MKKSIITDDMEHCYFCGMPKEAIHHIYMGNPWRKISDKNGFIVPLCNYHHNMSNNSVHFNKDMDLTLKRACQTKFEQAHSREEFVRLIGRNYL